jgi:adenine phosphoribosyltransferase
LFKDLTPVLASREKLSFLGYLLFDEVALLQYDLVAGIESRGFIIGSLVAERAFKGFVPVRKKGKLPREKISQKYLLEYGEDELEVHLNDVKGKRVLVVDDVLATGGTAEATAKLIEKAGGEVIGFLFVIEISALNGRRKLNKPVRSLFVYDNNL